jgi:ankyrin repeat protein
MMSSLHGAIAAGDLARVKSLIRTLADLNLRDAEGRTPLHHAIELEHDDIALKLLGSGADAALRVFSSTTSRAGVNALHLAAARGRTALLRVLLDRGDVDINSLV